MLFIEKNLKNFKILKSGKFKNIITEKSWHYHYACEECGYPFLGLHKSNKFCINSCAKNHNIGKKCIEHSERMKGDNNPSKRPEVRAKHSERMKGEKNPMYGKGYLIAGIKNGMFGRTGELAPNYGKTGELASMFGRTGDKCYMFGRTGELSPGWKNGVTSKNIPLYDTYAPQLEPIEQCVRDLEDPAILNVFCAFSGCKKQYRPTRLEVNNRIAGIYRNDIMKFYCCDECKQVCPLYKQSAQSLMERDAELAGRITKLNQKHLRQYQQQQKKNHFKANGGKCDWCEIKVTLETSIFHHEVPIEVNFLMAADEVNGWLFCIECDKNAHKLDGCGYNDIKNRKMCKK